MAKKKPERIWAEERAILIALLSGFKIGTKFHSRSEKTGYLSNDLRKQVYAFFYTTKDKHFNKLFRFRREFDCGPLNFFFNLYLIDDIGLENWGLDFDYVIGEKMRKRIKEAKEVLKPKDFKKYQKLGLEVFKVKD